MRQLFTSCLIIIISIASAQIPSNVPANGLMGYWPFTGNANDLGTSGFHGTVYGAQLAPDRYNNAACSYSFDGVTNYIITPYYGIMNALARTVSFWAKTSETIQPMSGVAWGSNTSGNRYGCGFNYGETGVTIGIADGAITYSAPMAVNDGQWHHYVFQSSTTDLTQVNIYQDNVLLTQSVHTFSTSTLLNTLVGFNVQFGRVDYSLSPDYFKGQLDDVGIWNRILSPAEISQLYNGSTNGLISQEPDQLNISIYPNPATSFVHIECNKKITLECYNLLGEKLTETNESVLSIRDFPPGCYVLRAKSSDGQLKSLLIVKE